MWSSQVTLLVGVIQMRKEFCHVLIMRQEFLALFGSPKFCVFGFFKQAQLNQMPQVEFQHLVAQVGLVHHLCLFVPRPAQRKDIRNDVNGSPSSPPEHPCIAIVVIVGQKPIHFPVYARDKTASDLRSMCCKH
jgi:hypothetical protein